MNDDIHHYEKKLANQLRLLGGEDFPDGEKRIILEYAQMLQARNLNKGRIAKGVYLLRELKRHLRCDFENADKKKIEELTRWINDNPSWRAWTKSDARGILKRFYRWLRTGKYEGPYPNEVAWLKSGVKVNELEEPEIISAEEIEKVIKAASRPRDRALIAVDFEGGFRIGEMLGMKVGSVSFDEYGAKVLVSRGKTGGRPVRLITSSPVLAKWLEEHPQRDDPSAPLWPSLDHSSGKGKRLAYMSAREIIVDNAKRAGIKRRIYPHLFRHSAATRDALSPPSTSNQIMGRLLITRVSIDSPPCNRVCSTVYNSKAGPVIGDGEVDYVPRLLCIGRDFY